MQNPQTNKLWRVLKLFKIKKNKTFIAIVAFLILLPNLGLALEMPPNYDASNIQVTNEPDEIGITAYSYLVIDKETEEVLMEKNKASEFLIQLAKRSDDKLVDEIKDGIIKIER